MIDLDELERKAKAATKPHDWNLEKDQDGPRYVMAGTVPIANVYSAEFVDAEHIAAANPATILALIERIRALDTRLAEAETAVASYQQTDRARVELSDDDRETIRNGGDR